MAVLQELRLDRPRRCLELVYDDGSRFTLDAEYLRVESPSAEVQGHAPEEHRTIGGCRNVAITGVEPVGNYGVTLIFDDGHDTGVYTWAYLHQLGREHDTRWPAYLAALEAEGLTR